ncbi:uncharacterized protein EI97DRAFT_504594 [Westerdykella ornata]|uniref:Large ribosomal subunit protein mL54 n=1 Tax=Westerdykella ornata TaxID=318751 RepID=A0A6A6J9V5_WESOR|nr:uncharacterized protein EI97DRAFT_504594 [Westerdykella ornata]KAF2271989.1 hypothetical protein EI97DRAFT_504594 [Westerdykella ornata]
MLCRRCIRASSRWATTPNPTTSTQPPSRFFTSTSPTLTTATPAASTTTSTAPPPPPSSSKLTTSSQTPTAASSSPAEKPKEKEKKLPQHPLVKSSVPAGTPLKGLNFLKNKEDPVAMEDSAYPPWLWTILQRQEAKKDGGAGGDAAGDLFSKSKKQRRLAAKRLRKEQLANPDLLIPKVPIYEQTIDLPAGDGTPEGAVAAARARDELRKALRDKRRAKIKEGNFLKAMG